jgi:hypothetical protein
MSENGGAKFYCVRVEQLKVIGYVKTLSVINACHTLSIILFLYRSVSNYEKLHWSYAQSYISIEGNTRLSLVQRLDTVYTHRTGC